MLLGHLQLWICQLGILLNFQFTTFCINSLQRETHIKSWLTLQVGNTAMDTQNSRTRSDISCHPVVAARRSSAKPAAQDRSHSEDQAEKRGTNLHLPVLASIILKPRHAQKKPPKRQNPTIYPNVSAALMQVWIPSAVSVQSPEPPSVRGTPAQLHSTGSGASSRADTNPNRLRRCQRL